MFYENLDKILKKKNLTLNKLAKGTGIAQSQTSKWKKGNLPGSEILIKICKFLEVSSDYLLDLNPEAPPILTDQEQELLEHYRQCSLGEQNSILLLAKAGAAKAEQEKESSNSKNVG